jgi:hypothetical protein
MKWNREEEKWKLRNVYIIRSLRAELEEKRKFSPKNFNQAVLVLVK